MSVVSRLRLDTSLADDVAYALVRAASRLVSTPLDGSLVQAGVEKVSTRHARVRTPHPSTFKRDIRLDHSF